MKSGFANACLVLVLLASVFGMVIASATSSINLRFVKASTDEGEGGDGSDDSGDGGDGGESGGDDGGQPDPDPDPQPDPDPDPDPEPDPQPDPTDPIVPEPVLITCPDGSQVEEGQDCPEPKSLTVDPELPPCDGSAQRCITAEGFICEVGQGGHECECAEDMSDCPLHPSLPPPLDPPIPAPCDPATDPNCEDVPCPEPITGVQDPCGPVCKSGFELINGKCEPIPDTCMGGPPGVDGCPPGPYPGNPDIPGPPPDLDCGDPGVPKNIDIGDSGDPHGFDGDGNGIGCEDNEGPSPGPEPPDCPPGFEYDDGECEKEITIIVNKIIKETNEGKHKDGFPDVDIIGLSVKQSGDSMICAMDIDSSHIECQEFEMDPQRINQDFWRVIETDSTKNYDNGNTGSSDIDDAIEDIKSQDFGELNDADNYNFGIDLAWVAINPVGDGVTCLTTDQSGKGKSLCEPFKVSAQDVDGQITEGVEFDN